jgi:hypothetical protein
VIVMASAAKGLLVFAMKQIKKGKKLIPFSIKYGVNKSNIANASI